MKSILLTSTALVAFAGAAAADAHAETGVSFGGSATVGYNDATDLGGAGEGFYWDANIAVTGTAALNGGVTASITADFDIADNNLGETLTSGGYVFTLSSDTASLSLGDIDPATDGFSDVDGGTTAGFNDDDDHLDSVADGGAGFDAILLGSGTIAGFTTSVSYGVTAGGDLDAMQVLVDGTFGDFGVQLAYQDEFGGADAVIGLSGSASFAGADIDVSYVDDGTETSTGIGVAYPVGPVTVGGYYSMNDVAEDNYGVSVGYDSGPISVAFAYDVDAGEGGAEDVGSFELDASYDVGNGLTVLAGAFGTDVDGDDMGFYAAATYDLGGGAELLFSYADDGDDAVLGEDLGDPEYMEGMTIEASFSF